MKKLSFLALLLLTLYACSGEKTSPTSIWAADSLWYQTENPIDTNKVDVLYYVSTEVLSAQDSVGNEVWQSQLTPSDVKAIKGEISWIEKHEFYQDFNIFAPIYHQYTFNAISKLNKLEFATIYNKVKIEACEAFDYYMEHKNQGRKFILAGFSQGAMLVLDILKHMTDEQYSQMVACYMQGYRLTAEDLQHPHVKAAQGETDKGVTISFNSVQSIEGTWPLLAEGAATCINPVNWKTDETPAVFTFDGTTNEVHVDKATHQLIVKTDNPAYYHAFYDQAPFFLEAGCNKENLHHWDLLFYGKMIHDNAVNRSRIE